MFDTRSAFAHLSEIREQLTLLAGEEIIGLPAAVVSEQVLELCAVVERAQAELLRRVGEWDSVQAWAADGAASAAGWLAERAALTRSEAARMVHAAQLCRTYPRTGEALARGEVSISQVETLNRAEHHRSRVYADHENTLLDIARDTRPNAFVQVMQHWRCAADDLLARPDPHKRFDHRFLDLRTTFEGHAHADGFFDAEAAAIIRAALDELAGTPDRDDGITPGRTVGQRRADALVDMCRSSINGTGRRTHSPPAVDVVIDLHAFTDADHDPLSDPATAIGTVNGHPVGRATVERLCCDSNIGRVVMAGSSEVLDLGRRARIPSAAIFRALIRRDAHCRFPGCDRLPQWTDAHHIEHWIHGGETKLDNLVLLCRRHHMLCHEGKWQLLREPGGQITAKGPRQSDLWHAGRAPPQHRAA